jgi:hypothetical protein
MAVKEPFKRVGHPRFCSCSVFIMSCNFIGLKTISLAIMQNILSNGYFTSQAKVVICNTVEDVVLHQPEHMHRLGV